MLSAAWAPALQRIVEVTLRRVRGTRGVERTLSTPSLRGALATKQSRVFTRVTLWIASLRSQ